MEHAMILWGLVVSGLVGLAIGSARAHPMTGLVLGFLLGPIGWLVALIADSRPHCPACKGAIAADAALCRHCRSPLRWNNERPVILKEAVKRPAKPPRVDAAAERFDADVAELLTRDPRQ